MNFSEYLLYLGTRIFKRDDLVGSDIDKYTQGIGPRYDDAMASILQWRDQAVIATATGKALDYHGRDRSLPRYTGEDDDTYRLRLLAAWSTWQQIGSKAAILAAVRKISYDITDLEELYLTDPDRWAEFIIRLLIPSEDAFVALDTKLLKYTVNRMKPGHTKLAGIIANITVEARNLEFMLARLIHNQWWFLDGVYRLDGTKHLGPDVILVEEL